MGGNINYEMSPLSPVTKSVKNRTKPNCNKCKNHNITVRLAGHKRYCGFIKCKCVRCILTEERRVVMAAQTREKRAQVQDEKCGIPYSQRAPVLQSPQPTALPMSPPTLVSKSRAPSQSSSPRLQPPTSPSSLSSMSPPLSIESPQTPPKRPTVMASVKRDTDEAKRLVADFNMADGVMPFAMVLIEHYGSYERASEKLLRIHHYLLKKADEKREEMHNSLSQGGLSLNGLALYRPPIITHGRAFLPHPTTPLAPVPLIATSVISSPHYSDCGAIPLIHPARAP